MSTDTPTAPAESTPSKSFTQDEVNDIIKERLSRQAKKFEDYDDLKSKVQSYEASLSTSESELSTLKAQVSDLSSKAAANEREALVSRIARDNGITDSEDIALFLTGDTEEKLVAQAARLASRNTANAEASKAAEAEALRTNANVPSEGTGSSAPPASTSDDAFALAIAEALGQSGPQ